MKTGLLALISITYHETKLYIDQNVYSVTLFDNYDNFSDFVTFIRVGERSQL